MGVSEFTVRIAFIGLPGIIAYFISEKLIIRKSRSMYEATLRVFMYAIFAYGLLILFIWLAGEYTWIIDEVFIGKKQLSVPAVLGGTTCGIIIAYLIAFSFHFSIENRFGQLIGSTRRFGDVDVWHFFNNAPMTAKNNGYVYVRDHKQNIVYDGYILSYSDSDQERELVLANCKVYNNDSGKHLYNCDYVYLARDRDDLTIEVPLTIEASREGSVGSSIALEGW
jgi:hypothetical protein